jgi:hypothetical protein
VTTLKASAPAEPPSGRAELEQLADALTQRGYDATVITPAPCIAIRIPGTTLPQMIYTTNGHLWWNTAQTIAPAGHTTLAADIITFALRTHPHTPATHDTTSPLATTPGQPPTTSADPSTHTTTRPHLPAAKGGCQEC